jgi:hypothetical protein
MKCGTIGCTFNATHVLFYSYPDARDTLYTDDVCEPCGDSYMSRPVLKAEIATQAEAREQ